MNFGANQRNVAALAVLVPVAAYMVYTTFIAGDAASSSPPQEQTAGRGGLRTVDLAYDSAAAVAGSGPRNAPPVAVPGAGAAGSTASRNSNSRGRVNTAQEYVPRVGGRRPEDRADPAKTDPTLRVELLAKLQQLEPITAGSRSLFAFSDAPPVLGPDKKIELDKNKKGGKKDGPDAAKAEQPPPPPVPTGPPPVPPPPAIPLKFYGFVQGQGGKRAFFRLGEEEIFMASEGQMVQGRYKIVRIGLSSAMVEDTQHQNNQQSLRIEEIPKENL